MQLPGLALLILGALEYIPDWKARWDFWIGAVEAAPGLPRLVAAILTSPYFGFGLIVVGLGYISLIQGRSVQKHPVSDSGPLRITVGESGQFAETKNKMVYATQRTLKLRIQNTNGEKSLSGCKVVVSRITPQTEYHGPWVLDAGFSLAAEDERFIPFASYGEAVNPTRYDCADSFIEILPSGIGKPKLSASGAHILILKATSLGSRPCEFQCKLWIDESGRLRIEEAR